MGTRTEPAVLSDLREMDNYAFEKLVADVWGELGYRTEVSQASNDKGLDVTAVDPDSGEKIAIQAKCYSQSNRVGRPAVQQYSSLYRQENADEVYIVSTGYYTDTAIESGRELDVGLIDGVGLCRRLADLEHGDEITQHYLGQNSPSRRRWGQVHAGKSFALRIVVALLGSLYLLGGYGVVASQTRVPMISQLQPLFAFFALETAPGIGLALLSIATVTLVLLKWARLWRWKAASLIPPASWMGVLMLGAMESLPALWIQAGILLLAFGSPLVVPAMYAFGAHWWATRRLKNGYSWCRQRVANTQAE